MTYLSKELLNKFGRSLKKNNKLIFLKNKIVKGLRKYITKCMMMIAVQYNKKEAIYVLNKN